MDQCQLDLSNVLMNPVCTRDAAETWWWFLVIHVDDIPLIRNNDMQELSSSDWELGLEIRLYSIGDSGF